MAKRYFVCSDIHGFYDEWMTCLEQAGFDIDNPEHILLVLGDIFDRGKKPKQVYDFIRSLPKERRILVRGNHEALLIDLVRRKAPFDYDMSNCTYETLKLLCGDYEAMEEAFKESHPYPINPLELPDYYEAFRGFYTKLEHALYDSDLIHEIIAWIQSDEWCEYYETPHYIFVHAFIPLRDGELGLTYNPNWREDASQKEIEDSRWYCPYVQYQNGLFDEEIEKGKTLVCGHWHTADFYNHLDYRNIPSKRLNYLKENPIYKSDRYQGLIGIDACTAATKVVNILVLEESQL